MRDDRGEGKESRVPLNKQLWLACYLFAISRRSV